MLWAQEDEAAFWARGVSACPCVEAVLGSPLLPVNVERKITLQGRNLQLFKVEASLCPDYVVP